MSKLRLGLNQWWAVEQVGSYGFSILIGTLSTTRSGAIASFEDWSGYRYDLLRRRGEVRCVVVEIVKVTRAGE